MKRYIFALAFVVTPVWAQQQPDPKFIQRALEVMQVQRNQAADNAVASEVRARQLSEDDLLLALAHKPYMEL